MPEVNLNVTALIISTIALTLTLIDFYRSHHSAEPEHCPVCRHLGFHVAMDREPEAEIFASVFASDLVETVQQAQYHQRPLPLWDKRWEQTPAQINDAATARTAPDPDPAGVNRV